MKPVKVNAKDFFGTTVNTLDIMTEEEIKAKQDHFVNLRKKYDLDLGDISYFTQDGVVFYLTPVLEGGQWVNIIHHMIPEAIVSGGDSWSFGIVINGEIHTLYDGQIIAKTREYAFEVFKHLQEDLQLETIFGGSLFMKKY